MITDSGSGRELIKINNDNIQPTTSCDFNYLTTECRLYSRRQFYQLALICNINISTYLVYQLNRGDTKQTKQLLCIRLHHAEYHVVSGESFAWKIFWIIGKKYTAMYSDSIFIEKRQGRRETQKKTDVPRLMA